MKTISFDKSNHSFSTALALCVVVASATPLTSLAGTNQIVVDATVDSIDEFSGTCTLREALRNANLNQSSPIAGECAAGSDTLTDVIILVSGQTYDLTLPNSGIAPDETGDLDVGQVEPIAVALRIETDGAAPATVRQTIAGERVLDNHGDSLELHNLIITGGSIDGAGGGILNNQGFMVLTSVDVSSNSASAGGGIYNDNGGLRIVDSQVQLNTASVIGGGGVFNAGVAGQIEIDGSLLQANIGPAGGGIYSNDGVVVIESQSALNLNEASASNGGAVSNTEGAELIVRETSFQGNFALEDGGAIYSDSSVPVLVSDAFFVDNEASSGGAIRAVGIAKLDVERGRFESNSAINDGGAISASFVELRQSLLEGNESVTGNGGAIRASTGGTLKDRTVVRDNSAVNGGGVYVQVLEIVDSRVESNSASGDGGGVYISNRALIETSRIRANNAAMGGGIYLQEQSLFESEFRRLLISDNTASEQGGGIWLGSDAVIGNTTITLNAAAAGGGIYVETDANARAINMSLIGHLSGQDLHKYGSLSLHNSIISTPGQPDCLMGPDNPTITSLGHNIADDESCFGLEEPTDSFGTNPLLLSLGNAGGNTLTYTPAADSPAVDAGDSTACNDDPVFGVDQRGALRPAGEHCDIGAHERGGIIPETPLFSDRFEQ